MRLRRPRFRSRFDPVCVRLFIYMLYACMLHFVGLYVYICGDEQSLFSKSIRSFLYVCLCIHVHIYVYKYMCVCYILCVYICEDPQSLLSKSI